MAYTIAWNIPFETIGNEPIPPGTIQNLRHSVISLQVNLVEKITRKIIKACILFNSSVEGMVIDTEFAKKHKLTLRKLVHPIPVRNVDRSTNRNGSIKYTTL